MFDAGERKFECDEEDVDGEGETMEKAVDSGGRSSPPRGKKEILKFSRVVGVFM